MLQWKFYYANTPADQVPQFIRSEVQQIVAYCCAVLPLKGRVEVVFIERAKKKAIPHPANWHCQDKPIRGLFLNDLRIAVRWDDSIDRIKYAVCHELNHCHFVKKYGREIRWESEADSFADRVTAELAQLNRYWPGKLDPRLDVKVEAR